MHARKAYSNRFLTLELSFLTNLKKSKNFLWAIKQYEKTKTGQVSKTHRVVETLERWLSVFNYCHFLLFTLKSERISDDQSLYFKTILGLLNNYDCNNQVEFADIDIVEKMLENRDSNSLAKFIHNKSGVKCKYQNFEDPKSLKNKIRFNYLDD